MTDVDAVVARVLQDLAPEQSERVRVGRADVVVGGRPLSIVVGTRGRMLLRITETTFVIPGPAWAEGTDVEVAVSHAGAVRRTGLRIRPVAGGEAAADLAQRLQADPALVAAAEPLDSTSFRVRVVDGQLEAAIVLMGASMTRMRVPPTATYVKLHDDQRAALLATAAALDALWAAA